MYRKYIIKYMNSLGQPCEFTPFCISMLQAMCTAIGIETVPKSATLTQVSSTYWHYRDGAFYFEIFATDEELGDKYKEPEFHIPEGTRQISGPKFA